MPDKKQTNQYRTTKKVFLPTEKQKEAFKNHYLKGMTKHEAKTKAGYSPNTTSDAVFTKNLMKVMDSLGLTEELTMKTLQEVINTPARKAPTWGEKIKAVELAEKLRGNLDKNKTPADAGLQLIQSFYVQDGEQKIQRAKKESTKDRPR